MSPWGRWSTIFMSWTCRRSNPKTAKPCSKPNTCVSRRRLRKLTGVAITKDSLKAAIRTVNAKRAAIHRLLLLRKADPTPISGLDALLANPGVFL